MKKIIGKLLANSFLLVIGCAILYIVYLRECRDHLRVPENMVLVRKSYLDSLSIIPHDTVRIHDTTIIGKTIKIPVEIPVPIATADTQVVIYRDSTVTDSIRFWQDIWVRGMIERWEKRYQPITFIQEKTIETFIPVPKPYEVPVVKRELFLYGTVGGSPNTFMFGAGLAYVNKKGSFYGLKIDRFGQTNIYGFNIGAKLRLGKQ